MIKKEFELSLLLLGFTVKSNNYSSEICTYSLGILKVDVFENDADIFRPNKWNCPFQEALDLILEHLDKKTIIND